MEELTAEEARVIGSLIEKQLTTPQYYPLTLNALVTACNQSNNRTPVVSYGEATVEGALASLREKGLARLVHPGGGSRVTKYRHVVDEALGLDRRELALVCVLLLRGPQTVNELRTRTERMADFDAGDLEHDVERLVTREPPLASNLGRRPGQREERYATTLTPLPDEGGAPERPAARAAASELLRSASALRALLEQSVVPEHLRGIIAARLASGSDRAATIEGGAVESPAADRLVLDACDEVDAIGAIDGATLGAIEELLGADVAAELPFVIGHYRTLALVSPGS